MSGKRHVDSPFPPSVGPAFARQPAILDLTNIPEDQEKHVYINSSNGYLDKRTTRLSVEVSKLQREVCTH